MLSDLQAWHYWIIISIICFIIEIVTPGFLLASLGIGALSGSLAAYIGFSFQYQLLTFALGTFIAFIGVRPFYKKYLLKYDDKKKIGLEDYLNKECEITEQISKVRRIGRVQVMGENWKAIASNDEEFEVGEKAKIDKIEGITLYISKNS